MTKQPEDWLDDVPGDDIEDEDDEIIWVSKSEIKRDAEELKRLGAELVDLGKNALDKIPLDADLRAAIELAQRIKMEGRRRQLQLIGKMLRQRDVDPIRQALDKLKNRHNQQVVVFHKLEQLRDRMVDGSDEAIEEVMNLWPDADRQQLRSLVRNARKEKAGNKPPKSSRQIFQYLRELAENEANSAKDAPSLGHHLMAQILIKALVAFCIYCVRIAQHKVHGQQSLMIRRMRMRPFIRHS
jgi:ribosome-associated protein